MSTPTSNPADPILRAALEDVARELVALVDSHRVAGDAVHDRAVAALARVDGLLSDLYRN
jgi:hypothetical protein